MATALDYIERAMRLARILAPGETAAPSEAADGLETLNDMLDSWGIERLMIVQTQLETFSWPANTASRTIGSGGDFNSTRPTRIDSAYMKDSAGNDFPMEIIESYDNIVVKSARTSYPEALFYDKTFPIGTIYLYGVPDNAMTLYFRSWTQFAQAAALTTTISLAPGYKRAVIYNLSCEMAPEYGKEVLPKVAEIAASSKRTIKSVNTPKMISRFDFSSQSDFNILSGQR